MFTLTNKLRDNADTISGRNIERKKEYSCKTFNKSASRPNVS